MTEPASYLTIIGTLYVKGNGAISPGRYEQLVKDFDALLDKHNMVWLGRFEPRPFVTVRQREET